MAAQTGMVEHGAAVMVYDVDISFVLSDKTVV
jgi:hypothetical protein